MEPVSQSELSDDFYERIKPRLHRRIGRELRLAGRILDIGCGSCDLARYLAETYCQRVTGVDILSNSFPKRRGHSRRGRVRCIQKDAAHLDFVDDRSVDAVVMMWALHEMGHPQAILDEAHRVLRPGGEILIVDFPKGSLAQKLWNEDYYPPHEVERLLKKAEFEDVKVRLVHQKQVIWAHGYQPPAAGP